MERPTPDPSECNLRLNVSGQSVNECLKTILDMEKIDAERAIELGEKLTRGILSHEIAGRDLISVLIGRQSPAYYSANARIIELVTIIQEVEAGFNQGMKNFIARTAADFIDSPYKMSPKLLEIATKIPAESRANKKKE